MRVRKAVPEGYKTMSKEAFLDMTAPQSSHASVNNLGQVPRELAPYCGIHKVGGHLIQPQPDVCQTLENDRFGLPSSSQESMSSIGSTESLPPVVSMNIPNDRKHYLDDDEYAVAATILDPTIFRAHRQIAHPTTRRRQGVATTGLPLPPDDFEDAGFLQPRSADASDVEMDY